MAKRIIDIDLNDVNLNEELEVSFDDIPDEEPSLHNILNRTIVGEPPILPPEFFENDVDKRLAHIDRAKNCPRCNKNLVKAVAINGVESEAWLECRECGTLINTYKPLPHQAEFLRNPARFKMTAGGFGCNPAGTTVVMHDGSLKNVEDIRVGDKVLGPDSMPRTVTQLHRGSEQMYKVDITINGKPVNSFEATGSHVLHLTPKGQYTIDNEAHYLTKLSTNITIDAYLSLSKRARSYLYLSYVDTIELPEASLPLHPYLLGVMLGDGMMGHHYCIKLTSSDPEIIDAVLPHIPEGMYLSKGNLDKGKYSHTFDYRFCNTEPPTKNNKGSLRKILEELELYGVTSHTKYIPESYLRASVTQRFELLAGLIDTDGCKHGNNYRIYTVSEQMAKDIKRLSGSLGIPASMTYREKSSTYVIYLYGKRILDIPVRVSRKQVHSVSSKDALLRRFKVTPTTEQPFYGFTLDGDQLYIDGGTFTVQHNSGKSRVDIEDLTKHVLLIPGARVCVTARTYPAMESTFVKDFYAIFPNKLVKRKNDQKHELTLTNGSEIIFRSFDDPTKLKSLNLTMAIIVEASDVPHDGFTMLQTRLRNSNAMIPETHPDGTVVTYWDDRSQVYKVKYRVDARHINLETNPASNWVKSNFLLEAGYVQYFGTAKNENYKMKQELDPDKYVQVVPTDANPFLPESYITELSRGKSEAWVQQFIRGSFNFNDNLVFPNFGLRIVPPKALPRAFNEEGRRVLYYAIGLDYGITDYTHIIFTAFSTETKKLYVYDELRLNNADVRTIAREYRKQIRLNGTDLRGLLMLPRFDGRSYNKRESDLLTIGGAFEAQGLFFEPSFANHEIRIIKTNALINNDQIEVYSTCEFLIEEALNYSFVLDKEGRPTKTPKDGKDHGVTALEFIIAELPHNLKELRLQAYLPEGTIHIHDKQADTVPKQKQNYYDPLKEDIRRGNNSDYGYNTTIISTVDAMRGFSIHFDSDEEDDNNTDTGSAPDLGAYVPR